MYDGGSTDGMWESVKKLNHAGIIPCKQDAKVFREGLRVDVFNEFRHHSSKGDWWLQLNVDEFYVGNPKAFYSRVRIDESALLRHSEAPYLRLAKQMLHGCGIWP